MTASMIRRGNSLVSISIALLRTADAVYPSLFCLGLVLARSRSLSRLSLNGAFSPPVSGSHDLFIKLWDVDNEYKNIATFRGHDHSISTVRFLPGDDRIVSASRDQTVRVWEVATTYVSRLTA